MPGRPLRIAWLGPVPGGDAGVVGVNSQLLKGLAALGHRIDCFFPSAGHPLPPQLAEDPRLEFIWGTSRWQWNRWYSRTKIAAFASGMLSRGLASIRLRREIARRHGHQPYDVIYQFSYIETFAVPAKLRRTVPLVIHPETHMAGELRCLIAERRLSMRCQSRRVFVVAALVMTVRTLIQRISIRRARLLVCISSVFRDHLVADYGFPPEATIVVPNPVRIDRFGTAEGRVGEPPRVLVLGRVSTRKGIEDVVAVAKVMLQRQVELRLVVAGGPTLWSDYTKLLDDLPSENADYVGSVAAADVPGLLLESDVLLQASKYEPFALTVAEALAAGVPVVATTEVGAIEGVDVSVAYAVAPGDVEAMADAIETLLERLAAAPADLRRRARAEAQRLFAPEVVCEQISAALIGLVSGAQHDVPVGEPDASARPSLRA